MRVSRFMGTNVVTMPSSTFITDAQKITRQRDVRVRRPVAVT
jgi:hypothetical protein